MEETAEQKPFEPKKARRRNPKTIRKEELELILKKARQDLWEVQEASRKKDNDLALWKKIACIALLGDLVLVALLALQMR